VASESELQALENYAGTRLPDDYRDFLLTEGSMRKTFGEVAVLQLYPVDQIIPINDSGEICTVHPSASRPASLAIAAATVAGRKC
jgi:hypothetical protein